MSPFPFHYLVDEVHVDYLPSVGRYHLEFTKQVRNQSDQALRQIDIRIQTCAFPTDLTLSATIAYRHPLDPTALGFEASCAGRQLDWLFLYQSDACLELGILIDSGETSDLGPLLPGDQRTITYRFEIHESQWGQSLAHHVSAPTKRMRASLRFPRRLVTVAGSFLEPFGNQHNLTDNIVRKNDSRYDYFTWDNTSPTPTSRYRLHWQFLDGREKAILSHAESLVRPESAVHFDLRSQIRFSTDFRSAACRGRAYQYTAKQAKVMELLWHNWQHGTPEISWQTLRSHAKSTSPRLVDLFRSNPEGAELIESAGSGLYRLAN